MLVPKNRVWMGHWRWSLMMGCWNWFWMNNGWQWCLMRDKFLASLVHVHKIE